MSVLIYICKCRRSCLTNAHMSNNEVPQITHEMSKLCIEKLGVPMMRDRSPAPYNLVFPRCLRTHTSHVLAPKSNMKTNPEHRRRKRCDMLLEEHASQSCISDPYFYMKDHLNSMKRRVWMFLLKYHCPNN